MESQFYLDMAILEDKHWWSEARRRIIKKVLDSLAIQKESHILEIGCGSGGNLGLLSRYGHLCAVEMDLIVIGLANKRGIVKVKRGSLPSDLPAFGQKCFDLIALLDVLEHVDDDLAALITVRNRLKTGGKVLLTVPAYRFLWTEHDVINHHKRRYVRSELEELMRKSGFQVIYSSYFNSFLFPVIVFIRLMNRIMGRLDQSDFKMPPRFFNTILTWIFAAESIFIPKFSFPCGVSILAVAEKI